MTKNFNSHLSAVMAPGSVKVAGLVFGRGSRTYHHLGAN